MSGTQQMNKRPKMVTRPENVDYFKERVEYKRHSGVHDPLNYRYYSAAETVGGRAMAEWLRPALSFTHFNKYGYDWCQNSNDSPWTDGMNDYENNKRAMRCSFELCSKLGIKYWMAYDSDVLPWCKSGEDRQKWTDMSDFLCEAIQRNSLKVIRIGVDLRSHPRYASGVTQSAQCYLLAASQIKRTLDLALKIDSESFVIRPPCQDLFRNVEEDMKRFAQLLQMTAQYKYQTGYRGQLLVMGDADWFMWDGVSCYMFLKRYNLEKNFKVVVGPGNDMIMCNFHKSLGGMELKNMSNDGVAMTTTMKHMMSQNTTLVGGTALTLRPPRRHLGLRGLQRHYAQQLDALARALRAADRLSGDPALRRHEEGFSEAGLSSDLALEQCDQLLKKCQQSSPDVAAAGARWQLAAQRYWDQPYE